MKNYRVTIKNLIFILFSIILINACGGEETISEKEKRLAKEAKRGLTDVSVTAKNELIDVPTSVGIAPVEESVEKVVHVTYTTVPTDSSYWYVVMEDDTAIWHGTVNLATPYFDFVEAKKKFKRGKGDAFFQFILQINKESIPSFNKLNK